MTIPSFTDTHKHYETTLEFCECPDFHFRHHQCKHQRELIHQINRAQMFLLLMAKFDMRSEAVVEAKRAAWWNFEMSLGVAA